MTKSKEAPTVDQIAAVIVKHFLVATRQSPERTADVAAEIAALYEPTNQDTNDSRTALVHALLCACVKYSADAQNLADAIDARIDARVGAGRVDSLNNDVIAGLNERLLLIYEALGEACPDWVKDDATKDAPSAIRALHARAEAAEAKVRNYDFAAAKMMGAIGHTVPLATSGFASWPCEHQWMSDTAGTRCAECGQRPNQPDTTTTTSTSTPHRSRP